MTHASLCQTAVSQYGMDILSGIVDSMDIAAVDGRLWGRCTRLASGGVFTVNLHKDSLHSVNIKDMPGKMGIIGHGGFRGIEDPNWSVLREWCGSDAQLYERYRNGNP